MRFSRLLAIFLLAFALTAPGVMADRGKGKGKGKAKHSEKHKDKDRDRDWERDRHWEDDDDWDDRRGNGNMRFRGMDRNGDGRISRSEWPGNDVSFDNHDWNGDGILSGEEVRPGGRGDDRDWDDRFERDDRWRDHFNRMDRNDDGHLSLPEWPGDLDRFHRLDLNDDGLLSLREIERWRRASRR
jgi:Ni/Co efflux regulator RcnB